MTRVLVVDDDPTLRRLTRLILKKEGYDVIEACCGEDAIDQIDSENPEVVVLDLNMPGLGGDRVFEVVRSHGFENPVLILSAYGAEEARRKLHADDWLAKPFDPADLVEKVHALAG
jgi:DNA-binding response OmpR family regulator